MIPNRTPRIAPMGNPQTARTQNPIRQQPFITPGGVDLARTRRAEMFAPAPSAVRSPAPAPAPAMAPDPDMVDPVRIPPPDMSTPAISVAEPAPGFGPPIPRPMGPMAGGGAADVNNAIAAMLARQSRPTQNPISLAPQPGQLA
jgi:hypothetical protein